MVLDSKKTCARPAPSISRDQGIDLPPVTSSVTPMIQADASDTRYSVADKASAVPSARVGRSPPPVVRALWHPTLHALCKHPGPGDAVDPHDVTGDRVRQVLREYGRVGLDAASGAEAGENRRCAETHRRIYGVSPL